MVRWQLYDPQGRPLWLTGSSLFDVDVQTYAIGGAYTLAVIGDVNTTDPIDFGFTVHKVVDTTQALTLGQSVADSLATPGQTKSYSFDLTTATQLFFDSLNNNSNLTWSLIGPGGWPVRDHSASFQEGDRHGLDLAAGHYTLIVDGNADMTGSYAFRLSDVATALPVTLSSQVIGVLNPGTATQLYRLNVGSRGSPLL